MHRALFAALSCLALAASSAQAQTRPTFEVASVKPAAPVDMASIRAAFANGETPRLGARVDGARAEYIYVTLQDLMFYAYGVKPNQIAGPGWLATERFDIFAKLPEAASKADIPKMLQALLEDRFKLELHRGTKELPALALVVGEGGPRLKAASEAPKPIDPASPLAPGESQINSSEGAARITTGKNGETINTGKGAIGYTVDPANRTMKIEASQATMGELADLLTVLMRASGGGLEVKDLTGLTGKYQIAISFSLEDLQGEARAKWIDESNPPAGAGAATPAEAASDPSGSPSLFKAVQSMGLRLAPRKVTIETLVIDHIEKTPTEN